MANIYEIYPNLKDDLQGQIPVLFLKNVAYKQIRSFRTVKNGTVSVKDLNCYIVDERKEGKVATADYLFTVDTEEDAVVNFRRKATYLRTYYQGVTNGKVLNLMGVDADGELRQSGYYPLFDITVQDRAELSKILTALNLKVQDERVNLGYQQLNDDVYKFYLQAKEYCADLKLIKSIKVKVLRYAKTILNSYCDIVYLDDRGGQNQDDINRYMKHIDNRTDKQEQQKI